jgi:hypothetical protein
LVVLGFSIHTVLTERRRKSLLKNLREPPTANPLGWPRNARFLRRKLTRKQLADLEASTESDIHLPNPSSTPGRIAGPGRGVLNYNDGILESS